MHFFLDLPGILDLDHREARLRAVGDRRAHAVDIPGESGFAESLVRRETILDGRPPDSTAPRRLRHDYGRIDCGRHLI